MMDYRKKLEALGKAELITKAQGLGVSGVHQLKKEELVEEILKYPKKVDSMESWAWTGGRGIRKCLP